VALLIFFLLVCSEVFISMAGADVVGDMKLGFIIMCVFGLFEFPARCGGIQVADGVAGN
jgi:hypothetical protein